MCMCIYMSACMYVYVRERERKGEKNMTMKFRRICHTVKSDWPQTTQKSQGSLEQKEQRWRHHITWFQSILQNYNNQNYGFDIKTDM